MIDLTRLYKSLAVALSASLAIGAVGCGTDAPTVTPPDQTPPPDPGDPAPPAPPAVFAKRPSKSSTIAISPDDSIVAMVNPDDGSISVFQTSDNSRLSKIATGKNPSSIVIAGDGSTAYVANRDDNTVARVVDIDGGTPKVDKRLDVGSSPVGLALSPSGLKLFVAEFAESNISVIDTQTMMVVDKIAFDRPKALAVTNNGDESDDDEILIGAKFYGLPVAGREAKDDGRTGQIVTWPLTALHTPTKITLSPLDSGFKKGGGITAGTEVGISTSPNQLASMAVNGTKLYITSVSASPEGPTKFDNNVFPVVYVIDLTTNAELPGKGGTANLARKVVEAIPTPGTPVPRFIPGDLSDIAFVDNSNVGYTVGKAGDVMLRLVYGADLLIGSDGDPVETDLIPAGVGAPACQAPTGIVASKTLSGAYIACYANRKLAFVDFKTQKLTASVESSAAGANAVAESVRRGERFFFTGRARWSNDDTQRNPDGTLVMAGVAGNGGRGGEGWSSCGSCHPDGLTDNITWIFGTGPRQTTSMDGSFSHGTGEQKQRIFNWTAVNDEIHDFELNVRGVSGGLGVITNAANAAGDVTAQCANNFAFENQFPTAQITPMGASTKELTDNTTCKHKDWDDITAFVKTISPPHTSKVPDSTTAASIANGAKLFTAGGCAKCHGGTGWTVSRRPYDPAGGGATTLAAKAFSPLSFLLPVIQYNVARAQISAQPAITTADAAGATEPTVLAPLQLACALRNVGTFGVRDTSAVNNTDVAATLALEIRNDGTRAEGRAGYNVPSLYGVALGAPYLHHGQAASLADLFTDPRWSLHTNAGNKNFSLIDLSDKGAVADLSAFLKSIDPATAEIALPTDDAQGGTGFSFDACNSN
jgi:YVTN family beta-propeller protein